MSDLLSLAWIEHCPTPFGYDSEMANRLTNGSAAYRRARAAAAEPQGLRARLYHWFSALHALLRHRFTTHITTRLATDTATVKRTPLFLPAMRAPMTPTRIAALRG